ncbi:iron complex outermembrane recepter protein [Sphingobacterium nematocida]|uniref:Iron complex outermembrane recepter protein n=1 Tax=Sphingobacterium nematocida TaxID=1513896 RepID=A0A1T5AZS1_9SPHI|nr:TonB-dependent receptor [Sphingobacterium nematocida]SKB40260.1 iron complex outermembrane recepter protein [Sphingobacterium nematocida]
MLKGLYLNSVTKRRANRYIFSCALLLVLTSGQGYAQVVQVYVDSSKQQPVQDATLYLGKEAVGSTDKNGQIAVTVTGNTVQRIGVRGIGFKPFEKKVNLDTVRSPLQIVLEQGDQQLEEVVVTAGRRPEFISQVPSSVSILNRQDIESQMNINTNLSSILGNTIPGLGTATNKATNAGQTLRGRAILVLIDGIPQSTPLMNGVRDLRTIDPNVVERIEVIKGATSIYGNGSGGGIINYITKNASVNQKIAGQTNIGTTLNPIHSDGTMGYRVSQYFSGNASRKLSFNVGGTIDYTGLQRDGEGLPLGQTDGLSNSYQYNAFTKVGYQLDSHSSLSGFYNYFNSTQHAKYVSETGVYGESPTIGVRGEEPGEPAGTPFNHNAMLSYSKDNVFGNSQLDVTAYINSFQSMNRYVAKSSSWYGPGQTMINSRKKGLRLNMNTPVQLGGISTAITYGIDLLNDVTYQDLTDGRVYIPKMNMSNIAPYVQVKADLLENLIFKGGLRYENATVRVKDFNTIATGADGSGSIFVAGGKIPYNATMFNAGLRYNKYNFFNPFVSFSQGFAINELGRILRRATENTIDNLETDPIITNNYEAGFSSSIGIFNLSAAYYISTSKLGVNLVDVGGYLTPQREPEDVRGYEVALDARLSPQWTVGGSYAYVEGEAKFDDGSKVYLNGSRIAPPKATGYLYYRPNSKLNVQLFWVHTGSRDRFEVNPKTSKYNNSEGPVKSVDLFNLSSSYRVNKQWNIGFGVENLLNKTYHPTVSQYRGLNEDYVRGPGMQTSLNLSYKF